MKPPYNEIIDSSNIENEPYHNILMLCEVTEFLNPIIEIKAKNTTVHVLKDGLGNIIKGEIAC
jgi:hypothetical protein